MPEMSDKNRNILDYVVLSFASILMFQNEYFSESGYVPILRLKGAEPPTSVCLTERSILTLCYSYVPFRRPHDKKVQKQSNPECSVP
jgi:hypothetical protein